MQNLIDVPFNGETVQLYELDGEPFVPVRPLCERFGIAWKPQFVKLNAMKARYSVTIMVTDTAAGERESVCIPLRKLPAWLYSIHPSKVAEAVRATLITYQNECDDVLWQHWSGEHRDELVTLQRQNAALKAMALASMPLLNRIRTYAEGGYRKSTVQILIGKSFDAAWNLFGMMHETGLLTEAQWTEALDRSAQNAAKAKAAAEAEEKPEAVQGNLLDQVQL